MAAFLLTPGVPIRAFDGNGDPVSGAKLYVFEAGTSTPLTVYQDTGLVTPHASPIVANGEGYFPDIFFNGPDSVKVRIDSAADVVLSTLDNLTGLPTSTTGAADTGFTPTARIAESNVQDAVEAVDRSLEKTQAGFDRIVTTGSSNAYLLDTAVSSYTAYATNDPFLFEANHANTGAATLNVDSLGAKAIKFKTGGTKTDPASGEIQIGHILRVEYDGTDFVVTDHWRPMATQAQAEAGTAQGVLMDPLRTAQAVTALRPDPVGVVKAWVRFNGSGTPAITAQGNVASITDNGIGDYTINFTNALADADYAVIAMANNAFGWLHTTEAPTVNGCRVTFFNSSFAAVDRERVSVIVVNTA